MSAQGREITEMRKAVMADAESYGEALDTTETKHRTLFRVYVEETKRLVSEAAELGFHPSQYKKG